MQVLLHRDAGKYLDRLNATDRERLKNAIKNLEKEPPEGDIKAVTGQPGHFRTRIGSYRILYRIKDSAILVTHIDPRGQAYKKKNMGGKR